MRFYRARRGTSSLDLKSILYRCSLVSDRPRAIDRYIDYFGESVARVPPLSKPSTTGGILPAGSHQCSTIGIVSV